MSALRTVTVKKGKTIYKGKRRLVSDVRRCKEEGRHMKTKETIPK